MGEKTLLVTGSTDGIGLQTALHLSRCPLHRVILHGRSLERCQKAMDYILEEYPDAKLDYVVYDFAKMANIPLMANEVTTRFSDLTAIVCNAGVLLPEREESADGIEMTFQVNHLAHFALVNLLLDTLKRNKPSRVVVVSSICYDWYPMDWDDLMAVRNYQKYAQYSRTKLANHMFAFALARRLENTGVTCNVYEPGVVSTKLLKAGGYSSNDEPRTGSYTAVYLVESDEVADVNGCYFSKKQTKMQPSAESSNVELQEKLWQISVILCNNKGIKFK